MHSASNQQIGTIMAKSKKNSNNSEFINDIKELLKELNTTVPSGLDPFEIAQHAAAQMHLANTPKAIEARNIVRNAADVRIEQYRKATETFASLNTVELS